MAPSRLEGIRRGLGWLLRAVELFGGALLVVSVLFDVFQSVVVPRWTPKTFRLSPPLIDALWPRWRRLGLRLRDPSRREDFLGTFAPLCLGVILLVWVMALVLGYGLMLHALSGQIRPGPVDLGTALYLSGTGLLTLGFGDYVAVAGAARLVLLTAAASGLAIMALVISFIFTIHGSFQRREVLVLTLDARCGAPPSGVALLETYSRYGMQADLAGVFAAWEAWSAEVLESHRANPILPYFRSAHEDESWVSALGAMLDAATLVLTTLEEGPAGPAAMMQSLAVHAVADLSTAFRLQSALEAGVQRWEYDEAYLRLQRAGYRLRDLEEGWAAFEGLRATYAQPLNAMARHFATPPAQWIGDRSLLSSRRHHPHDSLRPPSEPKPRRKGRPREPVA